MRTGGEILIDALLNNGTTTIFGVPGESYLAALDAMHRHQDAIQFVTCRHEGGAAFMADAWANVTGNVGVSFVTRGPGVTNASIGLHTAFQGSSPTIILIGQIPRNQSDREAFQEIDYRRMLGPITKWVAQVDHASRIPEFVNRAFRTATSGRPGPVALVFPEDVLYDMADVSDLRPILSEPIGPQIATIEKLASMLQKAARPLLVLGGSSWSETGRQSIHQFALRNSIPVCTGFRRQSLFDNLHPTYVGNLGAGSLPPLLDYLQECDLILSIGSRLGDATSLKYSLIEAPKPRQKLIQVLTDSMELGKVLTPDMGICSDLNLFAVAIDKHIFLENPPWTSITTSLSTSHKSAFALKTQSGPIDMAAVMGLLGAYLPPDTIMTNGAGNFADWPNMHYSYRCHRGLLAPISGAMGYSVPAAVAAKIAFPQRPVVAFAGDGDFLMNGQEIATAMQYKLNPIIIVVNNSSYGTIRVHQERRFPGRLIGTNLKNPDFAAFARSFGANGITVNSTDEFQPALHLALSSSVTTVIDLQVGSKSFGPTSHP